MNTKLDFEGRQRVSVLIEQIGDDLDEYAWRIVEQEAEIERLQQEKDHLWEALATVKRHIEVTMKDQAQYSTIYHIVSRALAERETEKP